MGPIVLFHMMRAEVRMRFPKDQDQKVQVQEIQVFEKKATQMEVEFITVWVWVWGQSGWGGELTNWESSGFITNPVATRQHKSIK